MQNKVKRGCLVNGIFVLLVMGAIGSICTYFTNKLIARVDPSVSLTTSIIVLSTIIGIVNLVVLIGTLRWNKICIYAVVAISLINGSLSLALSGINASSLFGIIINVLISCFYSYSLLKILKKEEQCKEECKKDEE